MKRDSTTIWIESPNAITPLPWVDGAPDFTGITEPTLSVLQDAYEAGKDNIEVIPDPIPVPPIAVPDWMGVMAGLEPYFNIGLAVNYLVFTQCFNMLIALQSTATFDPNNPAWRNFAYNLNLGKAAFTSQQKTEIEAIFTDSNIPFFFDP
jgi:hypothetical protein